MNPNTVQQLLRRIPPKWALTLMGLMLVYALTQPLLNRRLGWSLPSLAGMLGQNQTESATQPKPQTKTSANRPSNPITDPESESDETVQVPESPSSANPRDEASREKASRKSKLPDSVAKADEVESRTPIVLDRKAEVAKRSDSKQPDATVSPKVEPRTSTKTPPLATSPKSPAQIGESSSSESTKPKTIDDGRSSTTASGTSSGTTNVKASGTAQPNDLLYGILKDIGRETYISTHGLRFGPGSEEGHRLKHLERHLDDMPTRPGKHGVFDGGMPAALKWIDEAFDRASRNAKGTRKTQEDNRTVIEATFDKPIGYIGGRDGGRSRNPPSKRLKLIVEGNRFITAYPF